MPELELDTVFEGGDDDEDDDEEESSSKVGGGSSFQGSTTLEIQNTNNNKKRNSNVSFQDETSGRGSYGGSGSGKTMVFGAIDFDTTPTEENPKKSKSKATPTSSKKTNMLEVATPHVASSSPAAAKKEAKSTEKAVAKKDTVPLVNGNLATPSKTEEATPTAPATVTTTTTAVTTSCTTTTSATPTTTTNNHVVSVVIWHKEDTPTENPKEEEKAEPSDAKAPTVEEEVGQAAAAAAVPDVSNVNGIISAEDTTTESSDPETIANDNDDDQESIITQEVGVPYQKFVPSAQEVDQVSVEVGVSSVDFNASLERLDMIGGDNHINGGGLAGLHYEMLTTPTDEMGGGVESSVSTSSGCGEIGCNERGCHGYKAGLEQIDRDEIITCSVYEV